MNQLSQLTATNNSRVLCKDVLAAIHERHKVRLPQDPSRFQDQLFCGKSGCCLAENGLLRTIFYP